MFEVNAILFILLLEGFALVVALLIMMVVVLMIRKSRRTRAIRQLADQVKHHSSIRLEQTGSFLQAVYQLEDEELNEAVGNIDRHEKRFFQQLVDVIHNMDYEQITSLDASLAELIDTYKCMKPKQQETQEDPGLILEIEELREANRKLKDELSITKETMSNMIAEFGSMFGGGKDHELAKHEVVDKIPANEEDEDDADQPGLQAGAQE